MNFRLPSGEETLQNTYESWTRLKAGHSLRMKALVEEMKGLDRYGHFLIGTARSSVAKENAELPPDLSVALSQAYLQQAQDRLAGAADKLKCSIEDEEAFLEATQEELRTELEARVRRYARSVRPRLRLIHRALASGKVILHLPRLTQDESVVLLYLCTRRIPSRYEYLFDESTEDLSLTTPDLYQDEGVAAGAVRPSSAQLIELLKGAVRVLPIRGYIPLFVSLDGQEVLFRMRERGPVMEVEVVEEAGYRNMLEGTEAETFAGRLLRMKLEGEIELELESG